MHVHLSRMVQSGAWLAVAAQLLLGCSQQPSPCPPSSTSNTKAEQAAEQTGLSGADSAAKTPALTLWRDGSTRSAIIDFVKHVTDPQDPAFVPVAERIATFDNDGTLWTESPLYVQVAFVLDRVKALAPQHPEWQGKQPFQAAIDGDMHAIAESGHEGLLQLLAATHTGMTSEEFRQIVLDWLKEARHPKFKRPYTELTFAPMVELLQYLRAHEFKTYIVSGGSVGFMRPWAEAAYGIVPEQIIGTRFSLSFDATHGSPVLRRNPEVEFNDDGPLKPVAIDQIIGRRPIFAAGNSDGDLQMLQWTTAGTGARLAIIVHHTDAEREAAYDSPSAVGKLDEALRLAEPNGWLVVDMKRDWAKVFSFDSATQ